MMLIRKSLSSVPEDALCVMCVAASMPLFLVPAHVIASTDSLAMVLTSLSLGIFGMLVGYLIDRHYSLLGFTIGVISFGLGMFSSGLVLSSSRVEVILWWNVITVVQELWITLSWGGLAYARSKWLSRSAAKGAFVVSLCWLGATLITSFKLPELISNPLLWRVLMSFQHNPPKPTLVLWVVLWVWIIWLWHKWIEKHGEGM